MIDLLQITLSTPQFITTALTVSFESSYVYVHAHSLYTSLSFCVSACARACMQTVHALCTCAEIFAAQSQHYSYNVITTALQHGNTCAQLKLMDRVKENILESNCALLTCICCVTSESGKQVNGV